LKAQGNYHQFDYLQQCCPCAAAFGVCPKRLPYYHKGGVVFKGCWQGQHIQLFQVLVELPGQSLQTVNEPGAEN
jgi:hypothetical protein